MSKKHPNKEIRDAIDYAVSHGWKVDPASGSHSHSWGTIKCPYGKDPNCRCGNHCITSIWKTPRSPSNHARQLKRIVDHCKHEE